MPVLSIGPHLRARLGADSSADLVQALNAAQMDTLTVTTDRFEARLTAVCAQLKAEVREEMVNGDAAIRVALAEGLAGIRQEMSRLRVDVVRWSFLFWLGQFAANAAMFTLLLRALGR